MREHEFMDILEKNYPVTGKNDLSSHNENME
jgi:hypothetical protein